MNTARYTVTAFGLVTLGCLLIGADGLAAVFATGFLTGILATAGYSVYQGGATSYDLGE